MDSPTATRSARRASAALVVALGSALAIACSTLLDVDALSAGADAAGGGGDGGGGTGDGGPGGGGDGASGDATTSGDGESGYDSGVVFDPSSCTATPCAVELAAAGEFTCALLVDHTVRCWGRNFSGQLGYGTVLPDGGFTGSDSTTPVVIANVAADEIAAGGWSRYEGYVCARSAGTVQCWGNDTQHQLARGDYGSGSAEGPYARPQAAPVAGLALVAAGVVNGATHACAIGAAGDLTCWGDNYADGLGRGPTPELYLPPAGWAGSGAVVAAAAGRGFTCVAVAPAGQVSCFGNDDRGQSGQPLTDAGTTPLPTPVSGVSGVVELSARGDHTCARTAAGAVVCWGRDLFGQLGGGPVGDVSPTPVQVPLPVSARRIGVGGEHSCAVLVDDTVWCWGRNTVHSTNYAGHGTLGPPNFSGQIGVSPTGGADLLAVAPRQVKGLPGTPIALSLGYAHTCALLQGGAAACWGTDRSGQLGRPGSAFDGGDATSYEGAPNPVPALVEW